MVLHHHERYDGGGHPDGLKGEAIPLEARVLTVADALDALTTDRPYRKATVWEESIQEMEKESGTRFDPAVLIALRRLPPREVTEGFVAVRRAAPTKR